MSADAETVDAMLDAVDEDGELAFDGLRLTRRTDGYGIETPELDRSVSSKEGVHQTLAEASELVSNWSFWTRVGGEGTARRAFLRWLEGAPLDPRLDGSGSRSDQESRTVRERYDALEAGFDRTWGQLLVTVRLSEGNGNFGPRRYTVRHVDDADESLDSLESYENPRAAREINTFDEWGRYRPLKTAPTLVDGWVFENLAHHAVVETVRTFYPATIANWHRERRGRLDVDHWLDTAERQTGLYDVVDELPREALEWVAEACCVDSQCLKRREWHYAETDRLEIDGGSGEFPCREPCSLVIAAARQWAILETETEHTWEFDLTRSEKAQLEALIDVVADGRVDEIREADVSDGANRYRTRYLRAKRVDEDGNLCGVDSPTAE